MLLPVRSWIVCVTLLGVAIVAGSESMALDLDAIQARVSENFDAIEDLTLTVDVMTSPAPSRRSGKPYVQRYQWAMNSEGKVRLQSWNRVQLGQDPLSEGVQELIAFDGSEGRGLFRFDEGNVPSKGGIFAQDQLERTFVQTPCERSTVGRFWGRWLNGKSVADWLKESSAYVVGRQDVAHSSCVVVEVPYKRSYDSHERMLRFFFSEDHNLALLRTESFRDGVPMLTLQAQEFREVLEGIYFPISGEVGAGDRPAPNGTRAQPYSFEVVSVEANEGIPDSFFEIAFEKGFTVHDARFGMTCRWNEGANPKPFSVQGLPVGPQFEEDRDPETAESAPKFEETPVVSQASNEQAIDRFSLPPMLWLLLLVGASLALFSYRHLRAKSSGAGVE
jgi:hypothetical protein